LKTKNAHWNPLKTKQIQKLAVIAIWQPVGQPTGHLEKSRWLRSTGDRALFI